MKNSFYSFIIIIILLFLSCNESSNTKIFSKLKSSKTGITFSNNLIENDSLNYFTYSYIYMGGGVSAGDINNDGLIDLYFTGNMVENKLYLNKGKLQFEDISKTAGVSGDKRWYTGTTMVDINNDGLLDIYCAVGGKFGPKENQLFINNGDNTFTERAKEYSIDDPSNSVQSTFFDYDMDGDLDLYVANYPPTPFNVPNFHYRFKQINPKPLETDRLFRNDGSTFTDVTEEAGLKTFGLSLSATTGDLNQDGWPDIYVSNDFSSPDYMFINNQDGTFSEKVKTTTKNTSFYGMGVDIADFNNDLLLDILQVDMTSQVNRRSKANMASMNPELFWSTVNSGFHYQYMQNSLQMNNGNLTDSVPDFSNVSRLAGVSSTDWSWSPLFADLDNDGWKDIFIANGTRREINNRDFFATIDKKGVPEDSTLIKSLAIPSEKIDNYALKNNKDLTFTKKNSEWGIEYKGFSNGSVYVDLDNDGDLEIITSNIDDEVAIFENNSAKTKNHLTLKFKGPSKNTLGIGTKTTLYAAGNKQYQELTLTRGFQSSVAPQIHFGLDTIALIDSLKVEWPNGRLEIIKNPKINTITTIAFKNSLTPNEYALSKLENKSKIFSNIPSDTLMQIAYRHIENPYNDFVEEILLPHKTSMYGPNVATGDLNNDGLEDLIVGGASQQPTTLLIQNSKGQLIDKTPLIIAKDSISEDMGILIFDAENDGDNDIYIANGGNEFSPNSKELQDRLYINDGKGNFKELAGAIPNLTISSSRVKSHDFDKDGDLDLFVGGRLVPGNYPSPANSYILENKSEGDIPKFVDATDKIAPFLNKIGMVSDAVWTDFDNDGWTDLILIGEWMPITFIKNDEGYFTDITKDLNFDDSRGWWYSINQGDFDNDGDQDYIIGNLGLNYKYKANPEETFDVYFNDFDGNNKNDIVLSYFNEGEKFPLRGRECSSQQIPGIKEKFKNYESFSNATLEEVYTEDRLESSLHYQVKSFASIYLENRNGEFIIRELPNLAQLSSINQILVEDYNKDGHLDALLAGNLFASEVETPRNDAGIGLFMQGDGKGNFKPISASESGFYTSGDVKDMTKITLNNKDYIIVAKNNDYLQWIKINQ